MTKELVQTVSFETHDFEDLEEASAGWDQQYYKMTPGEFSGKIDFAQAGSCQIIRETWNQKMKYCGSGPKNTVGLALPLKQRGTGSWVGSPACLDTVIVQVPDKQGEYVGTDFWDTLILAIPENELESYASLIGNYDGLFEGGHKALKLNPQSAARLRRAGLEFFHLLKTSLPGREQQIVAASKHLTQMFLFELAQSHHIRDDDVRTCNARKLVKKATELVAGETNRTIELLEICAELGVSLRTLHYAFQEVTGMSPATWLRRERLNRVHKMLKRAAPTDILVKQVALDNGFIHAGHFSKQYVKHFGCLPSETLNISAAP
ncbi:helix-turn-helix domain-containing protein [Roseibium sp.]|uniref:AraC family transcriptional regulator n=1 Tax=Roseibium sp. TaxID=1936156 RepID=UPI003BA84A77